MEAKKRLHILHGKPGAPYKNHSELIELVGRFVLPTGITHDLRILLDKGATNNFLNTRTLDRYGIRMTDTTTCMVQMGDSQ